VEEIKNNENQNKNYTICDILKFKSQRSIFIKVTVITSFSSYTIKKEIVSHSK